MMLTYTGSHSGSSQSPSLLVTVGSGRSYSTIKIIIVIPIPFLQNALEHNRRNSAGFSHVVVSSACADQVLFLIAATGSSRNNMVDIQSVRAWAVILAGVLEADHAGPVAPQGVTNCFIALCSLRLSVRSENSSQLGRKSRTEISWQG